VHSEIAAVEHAQTLMDVADADPIPEDLGHAVLGNADAIVFNFDDEARIAYRGADRDLTAAKFGGEAVLESVFDDGLQEHAGHEGIERMLLDLLMYLKVVAAEPGDLDVEVVVNEIEFFLQWYNGLMLPQQPPQNVAQFDDHDASHIRIVADQR